MLSDPSFYFNYLVFIYVLGVLESLPTPSEKVRYTMKSLPILTLKIINLQTCRELEMHMDQRRMINTEKC